MDPVSQGVLGAVVAQLVASRKQMPRAAMLGGLAGMAPDLDVLIRSSIDPLLFLEYHRQFSHSLVFIPFGAVLCALLAYPLNRHAISFGRTYAFCLLGYATHGLLDACTSYGTQLFWPFSDHRVAWNNVSVVDPAFTGPLLLLLAFATYRKSPAAAWIGCVWAVSYLGVGVAQRERAEAFGRDVAANRGHTVSQIEAKPAFGSLLLWKTIYEDDNRYYVDAVRLGTDTTAFPGQSVSRLDVSRDLAWLEVGSQQARDLERFRWFSDGMIALDPNRDDRVIDIRYSLLPNQIAPLWGIQLHRNTDPNQHVTFQTMRALSQADRDDLFRMLFE